MQNQEKFTDEPQSMTKVKTGILICGVIGFLLFLAMYFVSWLYPVVSTTFSRMVLFHLMHILIFIATCLLRGSLVKPDWFVIYICVYIISIVLDLIGCIWRTVLLVGWTGPVADTVVAYIVIVGSWLLLAIDVIQIGLSYRLSVLFRLHIIMQNTIVSKLLESHGVIEGDTLAERDINEMGKELGIKPIDFESMSMRRSNKKQTKQETDYDD